jgi:hypothetical protein
MAYFLYFLATKSHKFAKKKEIFEASDHRNLLLKFLLPDPGSFCYLNGQILFYKYVAANAAIPGKPGIL